MKHYDDDDWTAALLLLFCATFFSIHLIFFS